jgi:hypothetical protein
LVRKKLETVKNLSQSLKQACPRVDFSNCEKLNPSSVALFAKLFFVFFSGKMRSEKVCKNLLKVWQIF